MTLSPLTGSSEEQEQILQTIEMFEVITQASPQDCQSMEILKDAYLKLGKAAEALAVARRLAETYVQLGQFSQAMLEYDAILQRDPANAEVIAALGELEERVRRTEGAMPEAAAAEPLAPAPEMNDATEFTLEFPAVVHETGTLIAIEQTINTAGVGVVRDAGSVDKASASDGNDAMARFLIQHRIVPEEVVNSAVERVNRKNAERPENTLPIALVDEICRRGSIELELLLSQIIDRSRFAYIPLENYDVDRSVVRMLPEHLTLGRLIVPFDVMSRTVMIATANPFDAAGKASAQQMLDYNIQWHLASPESIVQVLSATYKVGTAGPETIAFRIAS